MLIERWLERSKIERFGKITIAFNYFCKTLHLKSLREFWICVGFEIFQVSKYFRVTQGLSFFVNMTAFWVCVRIQWLKGCEYSRIPNIPRFCICTRHTRFWICHMAEQCFDKLFWLWKCSEYACSKFHIVLNMPPVLNIPGLGI